MSNSENQQLKTFQLNTYGLEVGMRKHLFSLDEIGELIPGLLHLNRQSDLQMTYLSKGAEKWSGLSFNDIQNMGEDFFNNYLEPHSWMRTAVAFAKFVAEGDTSKTHQDIINYRLDLTQPFQPLITNIKLIHESDLILSVTTPLQRIEKVNQRLTGALKTDGFSSKNFDKFNSLTTREREILQLLAKGNSNKAIGELLFISPNTVRTHRTNIYRKLDIKTIKGVLKYANSFHLL